MKLTDSHSDSDDMFHLSIKTPTSREEAVKLAKMAVPIVVIYAEMRRGVW